MSKSIIEFQSILGKLIDGYIKEKKAVGYKYKKGTSLLKRFDTLAAAENLSEMKLPKELVLLWTEKNPNESPALEMEGSQSYGVL